MNVAYYIAGPQAAQRDPQDSWPGKTNHRATNGTQALNNLFSIKGKTALITGGSRGIGEMIAAGFLANGAKVYISSRKQDVCDATAARLSKEYGGECISLPANLADLKGIEGLVRFVSDTALG